MSRQVRQAKQQFSALVQRALDEGPQVVTRHGEKVVVVLSAREYRRPTVAAPNFKEFLLAAPDLHQLELRRPDDQARIVEL